MTWKCSYCGYEMDMMRCPADPDAVLKEYDLSLCLNCGGIHEYREQTWRPMSAAEIAQLAADTSSEMQRIEYFRKKVIKEDLAINQQLRKL